jgi:hypothetical protein
MQICIIYSVHVKFVDDTLYSVAASNQVGN